MNLIDRLLCELDTGLRTVFAVAHADRPLPVADGEPSAAPEGDDAREESIRLMRVNHAGEVCAQALYQGQALVARAGSTRELLERAAREEHDHLAWCQSRLRDLGGQTSRLNPLFYGGSFALGVVSGLLGDKWSLGFLVETERQVEAHLNDHMAKLPASDLASHHVLDAMREDEIRHGQSGREHGGQPLPEPVKLAMRGFSQVMTRTTYWV
jgi:ubiquinone biosynthesis monooxygenase Coq7